MSEPMAMGRRGWPTIPDGPAPEKAAVHHTRARSGVAGSLSQAITAMQASPWVILLAINVVLLVVGCFLDTGTALLVLSPLLLPIARRIGVDPIHFGVIVVMNLTIGGFHPPFGLNIFVFQALFKTPSNVLPLRKAWPSHSCEPASSM